MEGMDKKAIIEAIIGRLEAELAILVGAAQESKSEATDGENRQEGKYDMRAQSAAYLAAGQAKLATELAAALAAYRNLSFHDAPGSVVATGCIVTVESGGSRDVYFIGPARGGIDLEIAGVPVTVITAVSPLGRELLGRRVGEPVFLPGARGGKGRMIAAIE
jgi:transcription elongation GreA/GreB family factor